jgi:hypothetical protein
MAKRRKGTALIAPEPAEYGGLLVRLGADLSAQYGRGFSWRNLFRMRNFYLGWEILPTLSTKFEARARLPAKPESGSDRICPTPSGEFHGMMPASRGHLFPQLGGHREGSIANNPQDERGAKPTL